MDRSPTQSVPFLVLPAEIRNKIYRLVLVPDPGYIDFSPKTTVYELQNHLARKRHFKHFKKTILPGLRLLSLNKQIRTEASSIFYGETEFRFTSVKGWYVLDSWLKTIGSYNRGLLRKLTVHVPWHGDVLDDRVENQIESMTRMARLRPGLWKMGLKPRMNDRAISQPACVRRLKKMLEANGTLEQFRLVMPDSFAPVEPVSPRWHGGDLGDDYDFVLDPAKFHNLTIQLVRLHGGFEGLHEWCEHGSWMRYMRSDRATVLLQHVSAREQALERGIEPVDMVYDEHGDYPVPLLPDDEILPVESRALWAAAEA